MKEASKQRNGFPKQEQERPPGREHPMHSRPEFIRDGYVGDYVST